MKRGAGTAAAPGLGCDGLGEAFDKWEGGVVDACTGTMYCVPQNAKSVLRVEALPAEQEAADAAAAGASSSPRSAGGTLAAPGAGAGAGVCGVRGADRVKREAPPSAWGQRNDPPRDAL